MENQKTPWRQIISKWTLLVFESLITLLLLTILFSFTSISFQLSFWPVLGVYIFMSLVSLSLTTRHIQFGLILAIILSLGFGLWVLHYPLLSWIITLIYILFRFIYSDQENSSMNRLFTRFTVYFAISLIFFALNNLYHYPISFNFVLFSYPFLLFFLFINNFFLHFSSKQWNRTFIRALSKLLAYFLLGLIIVNIILFNLSDFFIKLFHYIINGFVSIFSILTSIVFIPLQWLIDQIKLIQKNRNQIEQTQNFSPSFRYETNEILVANEEASLVAQIISYIIGAIIIIAILWIIYFLLRKYQETQLNQKKMEKTSSFVFATPSTKKTKYYISSNLYRKHYQQFLQWLKKKSYIEFTNTDTPLSIEKKIHHNSPHNYDELKQITSVYQKVRYSRNTLETEIEVYKGWFKMIKKKISDTRNE